MLSRLFLLTAFCASLLLTAIGITIIPLIQPKITENLEQTLRNEILNTAGFILQNLPTDTELADYIAQVDVYKDVRLGVFTPSEATVGSDATRLDHYKNGNHPAPWGQTNLDVLYPRFFREANGDRVASQGISTPTQLWIIEGTISTEVMARLGREQWTTIAIRAALALTASLIVAGVLARRVTRPIRRAVAAAEGLGQGQLGTHIPDTGPREVKELGEALNQLAGRITGLLANERERGATLSHQLRSPLTVLRLDLEHLRGIATEHSDELDHLNNSVTDLETALDHVITEVRSIRKPNQPQLSNAAAIISEHVNYWSPVAAAQSRTVTFHSTTDELPVPVAANDLGVAIDAIIGNIFRHTGPGIGYSITVSKTIRHAEITFENQIQPQTRETSTPSGSTGMGLRIAKQTIEKSRGTLHVKHQRATFSVIVELPLAPTETAEPARASNIPPGTPKTR